MPIPALPTPETWVFHMASCSGRCREGAAALPNTNSKVSGIWGVPGSDNGDVEYCGEPYEFI